MALQKIPFYSLLRNAYALYTQKSNYAYFYGAKNVVLTDTVMNDLINTYWTEHFKRYSNVELERIKNFSRGKVGLDCSGFITVISGLYGNSAMLYDACEKKTDPVDGKAGALLYKRGHCGIDLGYGYCMDMPIELHTFEISKIQSRGFTGSGELTGYDYSESKNF